MCEFGCLQNFLWLVLLCLLGIGGTAVSNGSITSSLPAAFFNASSGVNLVEGSVLQLFCTADLPNSTITWHRSGTVLTNDPPHICVRSESDSSTVTFILTVHNFQTADNGAYQCRVGATAMAMTQILTAFTPANPDDTLFLFWHPSTRENVRDSGLQPDNRTLVELGATIDPDGTGIDERLLRCVAAHTNDTGQPFGHLVWTRNGQEITNGRRVNVTLLQFGTRYGADLQITNFMMSDAGIYQCIATDDPSSDSDVIISPPFRLDTGDMLRLERISHEVIPLTPPNKLFIEVKASGPYREITWTKDGSPLVVESPNELPNFAEIFVREVTTLSDIGNYTVQLTHTMKSNLSLSFQVVTEPLRLKTILYANNSVVNLMDIGERNNSLVCHAANTQCCTNRDSPNGRALANLYFPNGTKLQGARHGGDIYRSRRSGIIRLNRKNNTLSPTGVYRCEIHEPDASGTIQNIFVGVYSNSSQETPSIQSVQFELVSAVNTVTPSFNLHCVTIGGPVDFNDVTWTRAGSFLPVNHGLFQALEDGSTATYYNTLAVTGRETGQYTCQREHSGNTTSANITVEAASPPTDLVAIQHNLTAILISWNAPVSGPNVTGYIIYYGTGYEESVTVGASTTNYTLSHTGNKISIVALSNQLPSMLVVLAPSAVTSELATTLPTSVKTSSFTTAPTMPPVRDPAPMLPTNLTSPSQTHNANNITAPAIGTIATLALLIMITILAVVILWRLKRSGMISFKSKAAVRSKNTSVISHNPGNSSSLELELGTLSSTEKVDNDEYFEDCQSIKKDAAIPIPVTSFGDHVKRMHVNRDQQFEVEFESLAKQPQSSVAIAKTPHNKLRNRFANIFPYDYNRVVLQTLPKGHCTDYINASFVDGYSQERAYIAAQGPMDTSLEDFWRMIWEYRLPTIVMLTRCFEGKKKCEEYWPANMEEVKDVGNGLSVRMTFRRSFAEYDLRDLTVSHSSSPDGPQLKSTQFHYTIWPDHGVPANALSLLHFIKRVRRAHPVTHPSPLLVHCSAGVGRTGSFVVLDVMLQRMKDKNDLNIYDFIVNLRIQRVFMVQSLSQYMFIHDAIDELITCGETDVAAENIRVAIKNLSKATVGGQTGFQREFKILQQVSSRARNDVDYTAARKQANACMNRYHDKIPNDRNRVFLRDYNSDYINASTIHGFKHSGAYITTQGPLKETVNDFWRMVWEYESKCIVMLCNLSENGEESSHLYWPVEKGATESYGELQVMLNTEEQTGNIAVRRFAITEVTAEQEVRGHTAIVTQLHLTSWPQGGAPPTTTVLELMEQVNKVQMSSGNKTITVMCNDGVGRSGAFMTIHTQLERLKTEGVVDIFQSLKSARIQRAGLVDTVEQYTFCYKFLADYLDNFELYANFKEFV